MQAVHKLQTIATNVAFMSVCLSVCLCVGHTDVPCKNGRTDRNAVCRADSGGEKYCWGMSGLW